MGKRRAGKTVEYLPLCGELSGLLAPFPQSSLHLVMELKGTVFTYKATHIYHMEEVAPSYDHSSALEGLGNIR